MIVRQFNNNIMKLFNVPIWKVSPFLRLLLPLCIGIVFQNFFPLSVTYIIIIGIFLFIGLMLFRFLPIYFQYSYAWIRGCLLNMVLAVLGLFLMWQNDIRIQNNWYGNHYAEGDFLIVKINEPLIQKTKSIKADGIVEGVISKNRKIATHGKILLYFSKSDSIQQTLSLQYGDKILINKKLQQIKNSGNPGAFNYERYAAFQQTFHNVFIKEKDWIKLPETNSHFFRSFIITARERILNVLKTAIGDNKDELGIAEALLIGYTNDLDKDLVQAYSNTGVVHIIAISGMHLGMIYVVLVWLFARIPGIKKYAVLQVILILICLWMFAFLTGAAASVTRSAVMFTFISVGKSVQKNTSIYNSLAASAFVMLCFNPYYLWDVGFQLSYFAVVGIVVFQKPIYNLWYIKNKWVDKIWQLMSVSIAAQILTFPVCIYYFHQFPNLFLVTNIIAVPLSTIILFAEIALMAFAWIPFVVIYLGKFIAWLLYVMNQIILFFNDLPFSVWDEIPATILSTTLLYLTILMCAIWLFNKYKTAFMLSWVFLFLFTSIQIYGKWERYVQQKIIVYNVPQKQAIDFVAGNQYHFVGDTALVKEGMLQNFHLKPGRIFLQTKNKTNQVQSLKVKAPFYQINKKLILLYDGSYSINNNADKSVQVDLIIVSKNPQLDIADLVKKVNCKIIIFDSSNSLWKIDKWKKQCEELLLPCFSVPTQGAYVLDTAG